MTIDQFYQERNGQSVLWAANPSREYLRGQCVQLACFYVSEVWGLPVIWADAYPWFSGGAYADRYDRIANDHNNPNQVPPRGALIVWGPNQPGSGGAGHIAICWDAQPGAATLVSFDSNWGGKTAHLVTHNWSNVVGWLVPKGSAAPAPVPTAPAPQGGDEVIANADQATKIYKLLRPNGGPSQDEINGTAGRRTFAGFLNDAQNEVNSRDQNLRDQAQHMVDLQNSIDQLNQVITTLQQQDVVDKQQLQDALNKVAELTTQLTDSHDKLADLQKALPTPTPLEIPKQPDMQNVPDQPSLIVKIIAALLRRKTKQ